MKFAIIGLGFISDRHISAIQGSGNDLTMACDIDTEKRYKAGNAKFFTDWEAMMESPDFKEIDYVSICTPNYLHYDMAMMALYKKKKVICEKPPVLSEVQYRDLVSQPDLSIVLQCRNAYQLKDLKESVNESIDDVEMIVEVYRDDWYMKSWKADDSKSGGLLYNIGSHYFDILTWFWGDPIDVELTADTPRRMEGKIKFPKANVRWVIAIDAPIDKQKRILTINGFQYNLTQMGFESLHGRVYENILTGNGCKLSEFKKSMDLIERIYARRDGRRPSTRDCGCKKS